MPENQNKDEKFEAREIRLGSPGPGREERPHGKLYRWFDNYWYHYKWRTIAVVFVAILVTICTVQMCNSEEESDITVAIAGPLNFISDESGFKNLKNSLANHLTADINGDGQKSVRVNTYTIYSEEEIKELESRVDEDGNPLGYVVNRQANSQNYQQYNSYIKTGDASVFFLSPWLFQQLSTESKALAELGNALGYIPEGGIVVQNEAGADVCFGVRLGDTALYKNNSAIRVLPADTVICLMAPLVYGNSSNTEIYAGAVAYYKALTE